MFLNIDDAARKLGVCQETVRRLARKGKIEYVKIAVNHYVYDVDKFIEENRVRKSEKK